MGAIAEGFGQRFAKDFAIRSVSRAHYPRGCINGLALSLSALGYRSYVYQASYLRSSRFRSFVLGGRSLQHDRRFCPWPAKVLGLFCRLPSVLLVYCPRYVGNVELRERGRPSTQSYLGGNHKKDQTLASGTIVLGKGLET